MRHPVSPLAVLALVLVACGEDPPEPGGTWQGELLSAEGTATLCGVLTLELPPLEERERCTRPDAPLDLESCAGYRTWEERSHGTWRCSNLDVTGAAAYRRMRYEQRNFTEAPILRLHGFHASDGSVPFLDLPVMFLGVPGEEHWDVAEADADEGRRGHLVRQR